MTDPTDEDGAPTTQKSETDRDRANAVNPDSTSWIARARASFERGDLAGCAMLCETALGKAPTDVAGLHLLGVAQFRQGELLTATQTLAKALALAPDNLSLRIDCASVATRTGDVALAIRILAEGARYHPGDPELAIRLANLLSAAGLHADAQRVLRAGLMATPDAFELHMQLAGECAAGLQFDEAMAQLELAEVMAPDRADVQCNMGLVRQARGDLTGAIVSYRRALSLSPDDNQAHMNLATTFLTGGDFEQGFREYEWRLRLPDNRPPPVGLPRWQGEPLQGRRLLVTVEQGYGDIIQFARFLPHLVALGGDVVMECPDALRRLFAGLPGVTRLMPMDGTADADFWVPLLSLPFVLGETAAGLPDKTPYLAMPAGRPMEIPSGDGLKVGLVWTSHRAKGDVYVRRTLDRRFCPENMLTPLLDVEEACFYSLQVGDDGNPEPGRTLPVHHIGPRLGDFADTAQVMAQLDLTITVDTAAAHLAGALGLPVWILLGPGQCEYRWGRSTEASRWYPKARLFRCDARGWAPMMRTMADELRNLARQRKQK